jgi:hypothetical protein
LAKLLFVSLISKNIDIIIKTLQIMKSPEIFTKMIEKAYRNNLPYAYIFSLSVYVIYSIIYYSLSFWVFRKSIQKAIYFFSIYLFNKQNLVLIQTTLRTTYLNGLNFIFSWKAVLGFLPFLFIFKHTFSVQFKNDYLIKNSSKFQNEIYKLALEKKKRYPHFFDSTLEDFFIQHQDARRDHFPFCQKTFEYFLLLFNFEYDTGFFEKLISHIEKKNNFKLVLYLKKRKENQNKLIKKVNKEIL